MTSLVRIALASAALLAIACGGGTLDDDITALQTAFDAGELEQVVSSVPAVLERCEGEGAPAHKVWQVEKLRLSALAKQGHGRRALEHMERLAATHAKKIDGKLYAQIGGFVTDAQNYLEAVDVLHAGVEKWPDLKPIFDPQIENLTARATASGDADTIAKLKSLGYL